MKDHLETPKRKGLLYPPILILHFVHVPVEVEVEVLTIFYPYRVKYTNAAKMRLIIRPDFDEMSEWAARYLKQRINQFAPTESKPFVLGLPTGGTPIAVYEKLRSYHERGELSFQHVVTFNMDEYVGLDKHHDQSYHKFMWEHLFKHVDVQPKNVNILNGVPEGYSDDLPLEDKLRLLEKECASYEQRIADAGGSPAFPRSPLIGVRLQALNSFSAGLDRMGTSPSTNLALRWCPGLASRVCARKQLWPTRGASGVHLSN